MLLCVGVGGGDGAAAANGFLNSEVDHVLEFVCLVNGSDESG